MENDLVAHPSPSLDRIDDDRRKRSAGRDKFVPLPPEPPLAPRPQPSRESQHGLDWFIFFLADVQTGFGPFVAVYLTTQKWTQVEIGFVLSIGGIIGLIGQMPGGAIVDAARSERLMAGLAVATIGTSALAYAVWPIFPVVAAAATLHALASCVLGPAIAAISLGLVGPLAIGERLGRNARFASLGNGSAAALMGACGYLVSSRSVFLVTFILAIPTLLALGRIREREIDVAQCHGEVVRDKPDAEATSVFHLVRQRPLLIFAASMLLFQLANAAMLPLMAGVVTTRSSQWAPVLIAACIIVPQAIVALTSPSVGRKAQAWGRRPLLLLAFAALAIRGLLFAIVKDPYLLVAVQVFDGITAAVFSVMVPLIVADIAFGSGHFNFAQGIVGTAIGIGASFSTVLAGYVSDKLGSNTAFIGLAAVAALGLAMIWLIMPETRRTKEEVFKPA
ncbi:MFS transporter [Bradyrhizobium sp. Ash2021]|uniref:MFS transporter n=1 Tax=Bradyrhizobium sp. Ash2021 TaxID=2954771 RepID=UPI0028149847|nr:MFS transporter [Bradyrhizobium sp. Ash2021]WMT77626.1 MFS transporter [Bradyrhizobium sp. Ash2021]